MILVDSIQKFLYMSQIPIELHGVLLKEPVWYVSTTDTPSYGIIPKTWPTVSKFTPGDVLPKKDIYKGRGYRVYSAHSTAKGRAVKIKLYEGSRAKDVGISSW